MEYLLFEHYSLQVRLTLIDFEFDFAYGPQHSFGYFSSDIHLRQECLEYKLKVPKK
jgi:hypothetical protein